MPVGKDPKLGLYLNAFKEWLPSLRVRFAAWWEACRAEPILFWHTGAIRYCVYGIAGILGVWAIATFAGGFVPASTAKPAKTADFQVICSNPACNKVFVINRKFGFDDFPVKCPSCGQETGVRALRCNSATCHGKLVAPKTGPEGKLICPVCGGELAPGG